MADEVLPDYFGYFAFGYFAFGYLAEWFCRGHDDLRVAKMVFHALGLSQYGDLHLGHTRGFGACAWRGTHLCEHRSHW